MWSWKKTDPSTLQKNRNRSWFLTLGLLVTLGSSILLLLSGIWFFSQTKKLAEEHLYESNQLQAEGLAFAISEEILLKNYAKMEIHLSQAMFNPLLHSALAINSDGYPVSYIERDKSTGKPMVRLLSGQVAHPNEKPWQSIYNDELITWSPINPDFPIGWVRLAGARQGDNQLMNGLHQQAFMIFAPSVLGFIMVISIALLLTFRHVNIREKNLNESNTELRNAAFHDNLTTLPNRELMLDRLQHCLSETNRGGQNLGICFVDLDGFKSVNDHYG